MPSRLWCDEIVIFWGPVRAAGGSNRGLWWFTQRRWDEHLRQESSNHAWRRKSSRPWPRALDDNRHHTWLVHVSTAFHFGKKGSTLRHTCTATNGNKLTTNFLSCCVLTGRYFTIPGESRGWTWNCRKWKCLQSRSSKWYRLRMGRHLSENQPTIENREKHTQMWVKVRLDQKLLTALLDVYIRSRWVVFSFMHEPHLLAHYAAQPAV